MTDKLSGYSTTPGSNNAAVPDGWPEGMLPSDVNNCAREGMARVREWYEDAAWINLGHTIVSATSSTIVVSGDQTSFYVAGRALRADGTDYGWVSSSTYGAPNTTINVTGFSVAGTPTTVEVGILSASNQLPRSLTIQNLSASGTVQYTGTVTFGTTTSGVTQAPTDNSTLLATTAFVQSAKKVRQYKYFEIRTALTVSGQFPCDGSKPQITEGYLVFSESFTPTASDSIIVVAANVFATTSLYRPILAMFKNSDADAVSVGTSEGSSGSLVIPVRCVFKEVSASTSSRTFSVRIGSMDFGDSVFVNANILGANMFASTLEITEYAP